VAVIQPRKATSSVFRMPTKRGAAMGAVVGVFDQALVDVVAGPVARKAKLKSLPSAERF
jgi:hypothetical protein